MPESSPAPRYRGAETSDGDKAAGTEDAENASSEADAAGDGDDDVSSMDAMVEQYDEATRTLSARPRSWKAGS